jgi:uncharacterized protein YqjF (DUF2071 family)
MLPFFCLTAVTESQPARQAPSPSRAERLAPARRLRRWPVGYQRWRDLLFLHWEVPADLLRRAIPLRLTLDTFEGRAYVGVIPLAIAQNRLSLLPPLPLLSRFLELNVRTYVHLDGRHPGVWFFSLDASNPAAVLAARATWRLPYCYAAMSLARPAHAGDWFHYQCERRWPAPARFAARYRPGEPLGPAAPGTLEHFLVERYLLFSDWGPAGLLAGQVYHRPYPLQRAEADLASVSVLRAAGLPDPTGPPHVLYSPGVDVEIFALRRPRQ